MPLCISGISDVVWWHRDVFVDKSDLTTHSTPQVTACLNLIPISWQGGTASVNFSCVIIGQNTVNTTILEK